jgi:hypothetical protein
MVASNPNLELFGHKVINRKISEVKKNYCKGVAKFTQEFSFENYFNEDNWIIFQTEFDEVVKVE